MSGRPPDSPAPRRPSRRALIIVGANAALLFAGLAALLWLDCRRTTQVARDFVSDDPPTPARVCVERLGGAGRAAGRLGRYLAMPRWLAPHRAEAVGLLGHCGSTARERLMAALSDDEPAVRAAAAASLGLLGSEAADSQGALLELLAGDPDPAVRAGSASALGLAGPPFGSAVGPLSRALEKDLDGRVRASAAQALGRIGPIEPTVATAVRSLARALADPDWLVCDAVAEALGRFGPAAREAVPELLRALDAHPKGRSEHGDAIARAAAAKALGGVGPAAAQAAPALTRLLSDRKPAVRWAAADALGRLGRSAAPAEAALERALKDESIEVSAAAAEALRRIRAGKGAAR